MWVDVTGLKAGVDFLSKIGQAIIDARVSVYNVRKLFFTSIHTIDHVRFSYMVTLAKMI